MKKIIQLWAVVVSLFAVFTVSGAGTGAASAAPLGPLANDCGYADCAEADCADANSARPGNPPSAAPSARRRHSDIM